MAKKAIKSAQQEKSGDWKNWIFTVPVGAGIAIALNSAIPAYKDQFDGELALYKAKSEKVALGFDTNRAADAASAGVPENRVLQQIKRGEAVMQSLREEYNISCETPAEAGKKFDAAKGQTDKVYSCPVQIDAKKLPADIEGGAAKYRVRIIFDEKAAERYATIGYENKHAAADGKIAKTEESIQEAREEIHGSLVPLGAGGVGGLLVIGAQLASCFTSRRRQFQPA